MCVGERCVYRCVFKLMPVTILLQGVSCICSSSRLLSLFSVAHIFANLMAEYWVVNVNYRRLLVLFTFWGVCAEVKCEGLCSSAHAAFHSPGTVFFQLLMFFLLI